MAMNGVHVCDGMPCDAMCVYSTEPYIYVRQDVSLYKLKYETTIAHCLHVFYNRNIAHRINTSTRAAQNLRTAHTISRSIYGSACIAGVYGFGEGSGGRRRG